MTFLEKMKARAKDLKRETLTLYFVARHPDTPLLAKLLAGAVAAYALSPIDLIPDFVPVLGYVDDLVLLPLGIALALKMVQRPILEECRREAREAIDSGRPVMRGAALAVVAIWLLMAAMIVTWAVRLAK